VAESSGPRDLDALIEELRARVDIRRRQGLYPPGLEDDLNGHFAHLAGDLRPLNTAALLDDLDTARDELDNYEFTRGRITTESRLPGGKAVHRAIGKSVSRQIQGVLEQAQEHGRLVSKTIGLMAEVSDAISNAYDAQVVQQLDDMQARLAENQKALHASMLRLEDIAARTPGAAADSWYDPHGFTAHFRGDPEGLKDRYQDLAQCYVGCGPVLDIGFGRGEFLELLRDLGVEARGIEVDQRLVDAARDRGLRVETGFALEYLQAVDDGSLGGLVMIQVIEHLPPRQAIDLVRVAAEKVRPGGRVLIETVNPTSLITYARAFWVDPDHVRPVHPTFLSFLFESAGFESVERIDRSPVEGDESLELLPGDDELTKRLNANFERLNALLYGPQDYAILATR
jgi:2-polyprenyl-3-methyl-5-hydroxy-6-metoxy-1,4-benzoquinol methylase